MSNDKNQNINGNNNFQSGGNLTVTNINYPVPTTMSHLLEKFKKEVNDNIKTKETIDKLRHYITSKDNEEIKGLTNKLNDGGYSHLVNDAIAAKEQFTKQLARYDLFESAQEIFACILADIYLRFVNVIYPKIISGYKKDKIQELIQSEIINPVNDTLEENFLKLYSDDLSGMLYFLTGNCHIKWK